MMIIYRYLYSNQLSGTIPSSIGSLTNLVELYVTRDTPIITSNKQSITIPTI